MATLTQGERFKDARTVHNQHGKQTMAEVSAATNVSSSLISDIESDKDRRVNYVDMVKLAKHYGVSLDWLCGLSEVRTITSSVDGISKIIGLSIENVEHIIKNTHRYDCFDSSATEKETLNSLATAIFSSDIAIKLFESALYSVHQYNYRHSQESYTRLASECECAGIIPLTPIESAKFFFTQFADELRNRLLNIYIDPILSKSED